MKQILTSIVILTITTISLFSQDIDRSNYQLLWEITGNDFEKPSYLFGSMHVEDKRVFEFCDSMLICLESCKGFSGELNMDSMVTFIMKEMFTEGDTSNVLKELLSEDAYDALNNRMMSKKGKSIDELDNKQPWVVEMLLDNDREDAEGDFDAFLDMYLYNYARKLGKKTYGLEKIEDQLNLSLLRYQTYEDYLIESSWEEDEEGGQEKYNEGIEELLHIYISGDMEAIDKYINDGTPDDIYKQKLLTDRNIVMADNIEKLGTEFSMFNVVGAAHLPGKDGVIQLLRNKGFHVRAVSPDFTGKAKFKDVSDVVLPWHLLDRKEKMECSIEFPVPAIKISTMNGVDFSKFDFYISANLFDQEFFMYTGTERLGASISALDNGLGAMLNNNTSLEIEKKEGPYDVEHNGFKGREIKGKLAEGGEFIARGFVNGKKMYLLVAMSETNELKNDERFFESFKLFPKEKELLEGRITLERHAVSFVAPIPFEHTSVRGEYPIDDEGEYYYQQEKYSGSDEENRIFYAFQVYDLPNGVYLENQNQIIRETFRLVKAAGGENLQIVKDEKLPKMDYIEYTAEFQGALLRVGYFLRGSRVMSIIASGVEQEKLDEGFESFKSSVRLEDFKTNDFIKKEYKEVGVSLLFPGQSGISEDTDIEYPFIKHYNVSSTDSTNTANILLESMELSPYYEIENPDTFLYDLKDGLEEVFDSTSNIRLHEYKGYPTLDGVYLSDSTNVVFDIRIILVDNWIYYVYAIIPGELSNTDYVHHCFNSLDIDLGFERTKLNESKSKMILDDFSTKDDEVYATLQDVMLNHEFSEEDLPIIYETLKKEIPLDTSSSYYVTLRGRLFNELYGINDENTVNELRGAFQTSDFSDQLKILNIVSSIEKDELDTYWDLMNQLEVGDSGKSIYLGIEHFYGNYIEVMDDMPKIIELSKKKGFEKDIYSLLSNGLARADSLDWTTVLEPHQEHIYSLLEPSFEEWKIDGKSKSYTDMELVLDLISIGTELDNRSLFVQFIKENINESESYLLSQMSEILLKENIPVDKELWDKLDEEYLSADVIRGAISGDEELDYSKNKLIPKKYKNQLAAARLEIIRMVGYDYDINNVKLLEVNKIDKEDELYNQYVFEIEVDYDDVSENFIGVCLQPRNKKTYNLKYIYSNYDYFDDDKEKPLSEILDELMEYFYSD